jgi:hypothetical protein
MRRPLAGDLKSCHSIERDLVLFISADVLKKRGNSDGKNFQKSAHCHPWNNSWSELMKSESSNLTFWIVIAVAAACAFSALLMHETRYASPRQLKVSSNTPILIPCIGFAISALPLSAEIVMAAMRIDCAPPGNVSKSLSVALARG